MTMNGGHIETFGMAVTELEGEIQKDHMIIIYLLQEDIRAGVQAL